MRKKLKTDNNHYIKEVTSKKYTKLNYNNINAITLISLVITIIILLILAGIGINLTLGENGIFNRAKYAKKEYLNAQTSEEQQLNELYAYLNSEDLPENTKETQEGTRVKLPSNWATISPNYVLTSDGSIVEKSQVASNVYAIAAGEGNTVPVPIGFYYVGGNINTGVVISDSKEDEYEKGVNKTAHEYAAKLKGNQFVWIPCKLNEYHKTMIWNDNRYEDVSVHEDNFRAEEIQIEKYNGFYVGRYEAGLDSAINSNITLSEEKWNVTGTPQIKANVLPWTLIEYDKAQTNAKNMYSKSDTVSSGLVTGTQWDVILNKMIEKGQLEIGDIINSSSWGNHSNSVFNYTGRSLEITNYTNYSDKFTSIETAQKGNYSEGQGKLLSTRSIRIL